MVEWLPGQVSLSGWVTLIGQVTIPGQVTNPGTLSLTHTPGPVPGWKQPGLHPQELRSFLQKLRPEELLSPAPRATLPGPRSYSPRPPELRSPAPGAPLPGPRNYSPPPFGATLPGPPELLSPAPRSFSPRPFGATLPGPLELLSPALWSYSPRPSGATLPGPRGGSAPLRSDSRNSPRLLAAPPSRRQADRRAHMAEVRRQVLNRRRGGRRPWPGLGPNRSRELRGLLPCSLLRLWLPSSSSPLKREDSWNPQSLCCPLLDSPSIASPLHNVSQWPNNRGPLRLALPMWVTLDLDQAWVHLSLLSSPPAAPGWTSGQQLDGDTTLTWWLISSGGVNFCMAKSMVELGGASRNWGGNRDWEDRYKHACCSWGAELYVLGGRDTRSLRDFWKYSVGKQQGTRHTPPSPRLSQQDLGLLRTPNQTPSQATDPFQGWGSGAGLLGGHMTVLCVSVRGEWTELSCRGEAAPEELEEHSMVAHEVRPPRVQVWGSGSDPPPPCLTLQGLLYVFGGMLDSAYTPSRCALWLFDTGESGLSLCQHSP
ncbi:unnamed protein product [Menidia menidia]|uniref:(Atlantic silverside) hypothetical protein n=1 Tax=Menidia menidia TaxID=238744 RepID=A0A8S4AGZ2_9TELE|nr:unnamed protein product [Menidia menidia]